MSSLEAQLNAVVGFAAWLTQQPEDDFTGSLLSVLISYQRELQRQLDKTPATPDHFVLVALGKIEAQFLRDELIEDKPTLTIYDPANDPRNLEEIKIQLLCNAITLFDAACKEMGTSMAQPKTAVEIRSLIDRALPSGQQD